MEGSLYGRRTRNINQFRRRGLALALRRPKVCTLVAVCSVLLALLPTPAHAKTELHVWLIFPQDIIDWVQKRLVPEFQQRHPDVEVVITPHTWTSIIEAYPVASAAGVPPDITTVGGNYIASVMDGRLQPLERFIEQGGEVEAIHPAAWNPFLGVRYHVPLNLDIRIGAYHKEVFWEAGLDANTPPQSWEEIEEAAKRTTRTSGDNLVRRGWQSATGVIGAAQEFGHFLFQNEGEIISEDLRTFLYNDEKGIETLEFMKRMYEIYQPPGMRFAGGSFATQNVAMQLGSYDLYRSILLGSNPDLLDQLGAFFPRRSPETRPVALNFVNGLGIHPQSKHPELAWEFINLFVTEEAAMVFLNAGILHPRADIADWVMEAHPGIMPWYLAIEYARPWPLEPASAWNPPEDSLGERVMQAITGQIPPQAALQEAIRVQQARLVERWALWEGRTSQ